ncbi:hypothetical protein [Ferroacidibacillus organovorans]|uniref:Uncharacterized protein n=1 Tax=Ferroacidibacillus organovorans TaxID=1765683 RepID=A0A1V4EW42_9BACL|nr:hypothetical protein [Ferroacidibacillus organovorans]OPG17060.1 hypothetical protein B2M26_03410 [Ferroacidibacillus organovorans]
MKNQVFIVSVVLGAGIVLMGCGNLFASRDIQQSQTPVVKRTAAPTSMSQQYGLVNLHYTLGQINEMKNIAKDLDVKTIYLPTKMGGPSGVYRLLSATGKNHVVELNFNDMAVLSTNDFDELTNWFKADGQKASWIAQQKVKLGNGIEARWWQVNYTGGAVIRFLALTQGNTWIVLQPNPAHPLESFAQAVANYLVPLAGIKTSSSSLAPKPSIPSWFLRDIKITEQANPTVGANYSLNYGETNVYTSLPQMNQVWYGALSNYGKNHNFGYSWAGVYRQVKSNFIPPFLSINVMEQTKQGGTTIGLLVPAKCIGIGNGDFVAFTNGQVIIATNKSGGIYYSVYPIKGISIP